MTLAGHRRHEKRTKFDNSKILRYMIYEGNRESLLLCVVELMMGRGTEVIGHWVK